MSTVAVDPRIRARRVEVARDAGRRRLRRLSVVAAVLGLAAVAFAMTFSPALDIEHVTVRGAGQTSQDAITEAAGVAAGDALVWFDTGDAERAVEALPWVDRATVERTWSGQVTIEVTERAAAAALAGDDGAWLVVDGTGRILQVTDAQPTDVPLVEGVSASGRPGDRLDDAGVDAATVAGAVPPSLRPAIATITGQGDDVAIALRDGGAIVMDGVEDAEAKLAAAAAVLATVPAGCVEQLDVSVASSPALISIPGCT
jgi:cell division protein FtsQ